MISRQTKITSLYRGQQPYKFQDTVLSFQSLAWEKEDQSIEDTKEDEEVDNDNYGDRDDEQRRDNEVADDARHQE